MNVEIHSRAGKTAGRHGEPTGGAGALSPGGISLPCGGRLLIAGRGQTMVDEITTTQGAGMKTKMKIRAIVAATLLASLTCPALADRYVSPPYCTKPSKPYQPSQWEIENFREEVRRYKECIADFVDEQKESIKRHQKAAEDAIEEWNNFVRFELR